MIYTSQYHQQFDIISDLIHKNLIRKGFILTQDHNLFAYDFIKNKIIYRLVWTGKNWFYRRNEKIYNCKNLEILIISFLLPSKNFPWLVSFIFLFILVGLFAFLLKIS